MSKLDSAREKINSLDRQLSELFCERMAIAREIAEYKLENGIAIYDAEREKEVISKNSALIKDGSLIPHYINFQKKVMEISRSYQAELYPQLSSGIIFDTDGIKRIPIVLGEDSYDIILGCGALGSVEKFFKLDRKVLILTDSRVPKKYAKAVAEKCGEPYIYTVPSGERSKSFKNYRAILKFMSENKFTRSDCAVAVGGGVVGDLCGFVASSYMRGIDFYNVPTTLLSQVDSSIGGKVAIDLDGYKNIVGAFYQPKAVLIDPETLLTLGIRQIRCGFAESLKMAATSDTELFGIFESGEYLDDIERVIERSLLIKKAIVERDVHESGERRVLNFGHTVGHAIESASDLLHGECVALGMLFLCSDEVRSRLVPILEDIGLPTGAEYDAGEIYSFILRDKKASGDRITVTYVDKIGSARLISLPIEKIQDIIDPKNHGGIQ